MLSSPLLPLYLIIVLSTLIFIESSIGGGGGGGAGEISKFKAPTRIWGILATCNILCNLSFFFLIIWAI